MNERNKADYTPLPMFHNPKSPLTSLWNFTRKQSSRIWTFFKIWFAEFPSSSFSLRPLHLGMFRLVTIWSFVQILLDLSFAFSFVTNPITWHQWGRGTCTHTTFYFLKILLICLLIYNIYLFILNYNTAASSMIAHFEFILLFSFI